MHSCAPLQRPNSIPTPALHFTPINLNDPIHTLRRSIQRVPQNISHPKRSLPENVPKPRPNAVLPLPRLDHKIRRLRRPAQPRRPNHRLCARHALVVLRLQAACRCAPRPAPLPHRPVRPRRLRGVPEPRGRRLSGPHRRGELCRRYVSSTLPPASL